MSKQMLKTAPVVMAVAGLDFSPMPANEEFKKGIENLHSLLLADSFLNFPEKYYSPFTRHEIRVSRGADGDASSSMVQTVVTERYVFRSLDTKRIFSISPSGLSYRVGDYQFFEAFSKDFERLLQLIDRALPAFSKMRLNAIVLRYIDLLAPIDDAALRDFVKPDFLPNPVSNLIDEAGRRNGFTTTEIRYKDDIRIRVSAEEIPIVNNTISKIVPDDLAEPDPRIHMQVSGQDYWRNLSEKTSYALMDLEANQNFHFSRSVQCNNEVISSSINELHGIMSPIFWSALTDAAKKQWGHTVVDNQEG